MNETLRWVLCAVLLLSGVLSVLVGLFGVFRFRFVMNRMHCAAIIDTLGILLILTGLMVAAWDMAYIPKLILVLLMIWIGSPIASHLVARMEIATDPTAGEHMEREDDP